MSDLRSALERIIVPINKEGYPMVIIGIIVSFLLSTIGEFWGGVAVVTTLFMVYFFRDPDRVSPDDDNDSIVLAPADGVVDAIEEVSAPEELKLGGNERFRRVSIFLNVFNVHVQRIPVSGVIEKTEYVHGKFLNITNNKYHNENERQLCLVKTNQGLSIIFVQIAGLIARRIVCDLKNDQRVVAGERYGCIKFGSRVDIYLPKNVQLKVKLGQTMIGGETIIGIIN